MTACDTAAMSAAQCLPEWLLAAAFAAPICAAAQSPPHSTLPAFDAATRVLIVAPHPDDETLCCAGVMQRVREAGGQVSVLWLTSGDASHLTLLLIGHTLFGNTTTARALGTRRMAEARAATALLGVAPAGQVFLGYPDRGLLPLIDRFRSQNYTSASTGADRVPYSDAFAPGHPYTGESLQHDFAEAVRQFAPTLILAPSPLDTHPDHRAAGLLAAGVSARLGAVTAVRYWIVHGGEGWPSPRGLNPGIPLSLAPRAAALAPMPFTLTPAEEDRKLAALQAHVTQMQVLGPFLLAFVRTTELFSLRGESAQVQQAD
jgi:LmbE family N-acetylglucosaminyl deacetylase